MELQKQFSQEYLTKIKNNVYDPEWIKNYLGSNSFIECNDENIVKIPGLYETKVQLKISSLPSDDFENAKLFFEAYKGMSPIVASQESIWAYLTHVSYYDYVKTRWQINEKTSSESLNDHFFVQSILKIARNGLARLWWPVYMTYDKDNIDPYHLTRIFFMNTETVQNMSESQFFSCKPLTHGILEYFEEHENVMPSKANIDKIMKHFNALGGVRELAFENKDFIKRTIETQIQL